MKAIEQYFPVVMFVLLCSEVLTFKSVDKAIEQYFPVVVFVLVYSVVLTFESVDETPKCNISNESY